MREKMKYLRIFPVFCTLFLFLNLFIIQGCSNTDKKEISEPVQGGIYHLPLRSNPPTLDPAYVQDQYGVSIVKQIFDGLVRFNPYLSILPNLAKTWQIKEKGRVYKFVLRKNARFHNLEPVTSNDVIFSFKRLLKAEPGSAILPHLLKIVGAEEYRAGTTNNISGMKIENDTIFRISLKEPHIPFLTALGMYQASIVPEKEVKKLNKDFGRHPVGTGPFKFISWDNEKSIRLKQFKEYHAGPAFLDEIQYKIYPGGQDSVLLADFKNGILDEMPVYGDLREKLADMKNLQWFKRPSLGLFFYGINVKHPNLVNPDLRKALSLAIDRTVFVSRIFKGKFEIAGTILPPGMPGYRPLPLIEDNNPALAKKILKLAPDKKLKDQPELEIVSAIKTPRLEQEMAMIKKYWAKLGIKLRVKYITNWEKFEDYLRSDSVQIYRYAWFADMPDPDSFLYSLFASESPSNFMKFKNKNIDKMLMDARKIVDPVNRANIYRKIEKEILEFMPLIPFLYMNVDQVYQPYVRSVKISALGPHTMTLNKIWLDNK